MKDMFFLLAFIAIVFLVSASGLKSCSDFEIKVKTEGLKSIVNEIWEGKK